MTTKENKSWYYIDDNGVRQGPFKPSRLQKWVNRGLFKPSLQLTQNPTDPNSYVSLLDLTRSSADPNQIFSHVERVDERGFVLPLPLPILPPPPLPLTAKSPKSPHVDGSLSLNLKWVLYLVGSVLNNCRLLILIIPSRASKSNI